MFIFQLLEDPNTVLPPSNGMIPTAYRGRMYYLSSRKVQSDFETNPGKYLSQQVPSLPVPVRIAVVGPPKSGKTTGTCTVHVYIIMCINIVQYILYMYIVHS